MSDHMNYHLIQSTSQHVNVSAAVGLMTVDVKRLKSFVLSDLKFSKNRDFLFFFVFYLIFDVWSGG